MNKSYPPGPIGKSESLVGATYLARVSRSRLDRLYNGYKQNWYENNMGAWMDIQAYVVHM